MAALASVLQKRLPPSFAFQDEEEGLRKPSKGIHSEFVDLPPQEEELIFQAVRLEDKNKISMLLRHGTDVNSVHEGDPCLVRSPSLFRNIQMRKYCPLHVAVLHAGREVIELLCDSGADINQRDGTNRTPLHLATAAARYDIVKYLLDKGADMNVQTTSGRTPVMEAVSLNRFRLVDLFINAGADLDIGDIKGMTPLAFAAMQGQVDVVIVDRLLKAGCDANRILPKGATPLMFAVSIKSVKKIEALLKAGADVNAADNAGVTSFHMATNDGQGVYVAKLLLRHGAIPDTKNKSGKTPLDYAILQGKLQVLRMLLLADCDRDYSVFDSESVQRLCDRLPAFKEWLLNEMYNPRSLKRICRGSIRKHLSARGMAQIDKLPLPAILKDFLLVKYFE